MTSNTRTPGWEEVAAKLPLDWKHYPADAQEGWEMLTRAYARYLAAQEAGMKSIEREQELEKKLAAAQADLASLRKEARPSEEAITLAQRLVYQNVNCDPEKPSEAAIMARELLRIAEVVK